MDDLVLGGGGPALQARLAEAASHSAIVWSTSHHAWIVLSHQAVAEGFRDPRLSSDRMTAFERLAERRPAAFRTVVDVLAGWMVFRDPPVHTRLRAPVRAAFTPRRIAALEHTVATVVDELLDPIAEAGGGDLAATMAGPLPAIVIAELLGVPAGDRALFQQWSDELAGIVFSASAKDVDADAAIAGATAFSRYFGGLVEQRRAHPGNDLISAVVAAATGADDRLRPAEVVGACAMLLFAGHETTTSFLANAIWTLFDHEGELSRWRADSHLDATAVEELLRLAGPAVVMVRRATTAMGWCGADIAAGDTVYLCMAAANIDPSVFHRPGRLDVGRDPNPHLGFGWGLHHCLGAPLARMEARIALRRTIDRFPALRPAAGVRWSGGVLGQSTGAVPVVT